MQKTVTIQEQKQYYDSLWNARIRAKLCEDELCRERFILQNVRAVIGKLGRRVKIIDLGCGRGWITSSLSRYGDVVGVDLSPGSAQKLYPNLRFIQANIAVDEVEGRYDVVVSSEVLEHMTPEDQRRYVEKASRLLVDGGYLILTTPNSVVAKKLDAEPSKLQLIENWLEKGELESLLSAHFKVVYTGSAVFHPVFVRKHALTEKMYGFLIFRSKAYRLVNKLLRGSNHGLYLTFVARKR